MFIKKSGSRLYIGRIRLIFERNWRNRPYPWWFNQKYSDDGMRRICVPFLTLDIRAY